MVPIPSGGELISEQRCSAQDFDQLFQDVIHKHGLSNGFIHYRDEEGRRYLLIRNGEPFCAAWDDGYGGQATPMSDFFETFLEAPQ